MGEIEEVDDELAHAVDPHERAVDHAVVGGEGVARHAARHDAEVILDRGQGRLELVREHGHELEPHLPLFGLELLRLALEEQVLGRLAHRVGELLGREGLGQKIEGAVLGGVDRHFERGVGGDHDREDVVFHARSAGKNLQSLHVRELVVEEEEVRRFGLQESERLSPRGRHARGKRDLLAEIGQRDAEVLQDAFRAEPHARLVVHDEHRECRHGPIPFRTATEAPFGFAQGRRRTQRGKKIQERKGRKIQFPFSHFFSAFLLRVLRVLCGSSFSAAHASSWRTGRVTMKVVPVGPSAGSALDSTSMFPRCILTMP